MGGICGRVANRIANARFTLNENTYQVAANIAPHHLHGGLLGFDHQHWQAKVVSLDSQAAVCFTYTSADGEEGYPGKLTCQVTYSLNDRSELGINYSAYVEDQPTIVNLTNHTYWNLGDTKTVLDHQIAIHTDYYLEVDERMIPSGAFVAVENTPMDCRIPVRVGERHRELSVDPEDSTKVGYDHCYVFSENLSPDTKSLLHVASLSHPETGLSMNILTDQPGVQFYMGVFLDGSKAMGGHPQYGGLCLECQQLPDAPNHAEFPSIRLDPGQTYRQTTIYRINHP